MDTSNLDQILMFGGDSPIWMDGSTQSQCDEIEHAYGRDNLKQITGS